MGPGPWWARRRTEFIPFGTAPNGMNSVLPNEAGRSRQRHGVQVQAAVGPDQEEGVVLVQLVEVLHALERRDGLVGQPRLAAAADRLGDALDLVDPLRGDLH